MATETLSMSEIFVGWVARSLVEADKELADLFGSEHAHYSTGVALAGFAELLQAVQRGERTPEEIMILVFAHRNEYVQEQQP